MAFCDLKANETHMLQKFYTMLSKADIKSFKLKVGLISSKTGAPILAVDGPADSAESGL